ncbi:MAG: 50S ribosomal protein L10 [Bdellovibrionales bacterium]
MITKTNKKNQIASLSDSFSKAKSSFLVNCIGLNVEEMTHLRKQLKQNQADIKVIRNTLARLALDSNSDLKSVYDARLDGPNAFVFVYDDVVGVAKVMDDMSKQNEVFKVKCGILEGALVSEKEVKILSTLPSLEVLRSQLVGLLSTPLTKFLGTLKAVPESCVRVLNSYKDKQGN